MTMHQLNSSPGSSSRQKLSYWLLLVVLTLALLPRLFTLNAFLTADEDDQLDFSARFLQTVLERDWAGALVLGYPGVPTQALGALGLWLGYQSELLDHHVSAGLKTGSPLPTPPAIPPERSHVVFLPLVAKAPLSLPSYLAALKTDPLHFIAWVRMPLAIATALCIGLMFWLLRNLIGQQAAFVAAALISFDPFLLAYSRVIHVDALLTCFMITSLLAFLWYLRGGNWGWALVSGVLGGLAALTKSPGMLLVPILPVAGWLFVRAERYPGVMKRLIIALLCWGTMALVAFFALWPAMWSRPAFALEWILLNAQSVASAPHPTSGLFWGKLVTDQSPWYYLVGFPFQLTPLTSIGLLLEAFFIIKGLIVKRSIRDHSPVAFGVIEWVLPVFIVLFVGPVALAGRRWLRYILPVYPALQIMAALGLWRLTLGSKARTFLRWGLVGVIVLQIIQVAIFHPYYLSYYNPLLGGGKTAPQYVVVGWGEGLDQAAEYLNQKPNAADLTVAAWYSWQFAPYFHGRTVDLSSNEPALTADYTVFYINQLQRGFPSAELLAYFADRAPEKIITLGGIDYAFIYPGPIIGPKPPAALSTPLNAPFGGAITLLGVDAPSAFNRQPEALPVTLYWQVNNSLPADLNVSIRLRGADGSLWGQTDRFPIGGLVRTQNWPAGQVVRDEYLLAANPAIPPGIYTLDILLYHFAGGAVLGQVNGAGAITITAPQRPVKVNTLTAWHANQDMPLAQNAASLGGDVRLVANTPPPADILPGADLPLTLYWQARRTPRADHVMTVLAQSATGVELPLWSGPVGSAETPVSTWKRGQLFAQPLTAAFTADVPPGDYTLAARLEGESATATLGRVTLGQYPHTFTRPDAITPLEAVWGRPPQIRLIGYTASSSADQLLLTLYWQAETVQPANYQVFIHLTNAAGEIIAQHDAAPVAGARPTRTWLPGEIIADAHSLVPPADDYTLWVGLYNPVDGARLAVTADGLPVSDNRLQLGE